MVPLAEAWRPWRGAAACALWSYYRIAKKRDGAPQLITKKSPAKTAAVQSKTVQNKIMQKKAVSRRRHGG
jgi:hypothetical protein